MGWGRRDRRDWPSYVPRPKRLKVSTERLAELLAKAVKFVKESVVLSQVVEEVELSRGRFYFWREEGDLMARVTPLHRGVMLLEHELRGGWTEDGRGNLSKVLRLLEGDEDGSFHGLGSLARAAKDQRRGGRKKADEAASVQERLHRELGIPIHVLAEPRLWYARHRVPRIAKLDPKRGRALVRFEKFSLSGETFGGTCLYARVHSEWGCYAVRPSASSTISSAEAWLRKRGWQSW